MEMQIDHLSDIISNLPDHAIETILLHLPIMDAVRTSVLSRKWRYKWATISELVFDDKSILPTEDGTIRIDKLVNFIDRVLLLHRGPLHKFDLSTRFLNDTFIDAWILFLSRTGVKELSLKFQGEKPYKVPYSFFSCRAITCLNLFSCILKPPSVFKGFSVLKSLNLESVTLSNEVFESIISNCIALERLRLIKLNGCTHLKIRGLNLQHFCFNGELTDICFIDAPKLSFVSIILHNSLFKQVGQGESSNLIKVLGSLTGLEKLTIECYFIQVTQLYENFYFPFSAIGNIPVRLPGTYDRLKCLSLVINFEDLNETLVMLCLLQSSPSLHELDFVGDEAVVTELVEDFWEAQGHLDCSMNHLRVGRAYNIGGARPELQFIKFLLVNSPVLEKLNVTPKSGKNIDKMKMLEELLRFRRASTSAEIIYNRTSED
ncbi:hypothetical protein HHK36_006914 [Tetracentron sinense]|uniref:F-box domain-containing protein n=1 Tax=Tetracentron sinense TaxID=13715 RepID=A0A835DKS4_TETSI|nr:hypothetical protein HHK36_006914 [Tetracentron sinense]